MKRICGPAPAGTGTGTGRSVAVLGSMGVARDGDGWRTKDRVAETVGALVEHGWDVTYIAQASEPQPFLRHRMAPGVRVLPLPVRVRSLADLRRLVTGLRVLVAAPVALVFMPRVRTALALIVLGERAVMYAGLAWAQLPDTATWRARLELLAARRAGSVIVAGEALNELFAARARVIACAVPLVRREVGERLQAGGEVALRGDRELRVLFVGSVGRRKGIDSLLQALEGRERIAVRIVGHHADGALGERVRAFAAQGALEYSEYLEWHELRELYAWADVLCLPSRSEGFPRVAYEAAAFDAALLLTPVGGIPSRLAHRRDALFVTPGSVEELGAALDVLAADPALVARLATQAKRTLSAVFVDTDPSRQFDRALRRVAGDGPPPATSAVSR